MKGTGEAITLEAALRDLKHTDARVRAQAADGLGRAGPEARLEAARALVEAAADAEPAVRYAVLLSLGELGCTLGAEAAAARLEDPEPLVREAAAIALGQIGAEDAEGAERAFEPLTRALASEHPELRFQAIASLVEISPERAAPLVRAGLGDVDEKIRAQAVAALGDAREPADVPALYARLQEDEADAVRFEAALALSRLGDRRGVPRLLQALEERDRGLDAATALAELNAASDPMVRETLGRLLARRLFGDPLVRVRAAEALARAGDARGLHYLSRAARARRDDVRGLAEDVLSTLEP